MIKIASLSVVAALLALGLAAAPAQAGPNRAWVSGHGTDSGGCGPVAAPCRTFAFALTQTAAGGEIDVLEPAGYGPVTITKAISIVNDGADAATIGMASAGNGVTIIASAGDSVHLRGLTIDGFGIGSNGIQFNRGGNLAIENCVIRNFEHSGIIIQPSTSSSFSVSNTIASNNFVDGIEVFSTGSASVTGVLSKVTANTNGFFGINVEGFGTTGALNVTIVNGVASNNTSVGINAVSANTAVTVRNSVASYSGTGLFAAKAILRVGHSVVTGNGTGVKLAGGNIFSYGDNDIDGNTNNNTGALTPLAMH